MDDMLDVDLHDGDLMAEIQLVAELMAAAQASTGPLTQEAVDEILGVRRTIPHQRG